MPELEKPEAGHQDRPGQPTRVAYFDASLRGETGHQANACRWIGQEFRRRGLDVDTFAGRSIQRNLAAELDARPCFRLLPYEQSKALGGLDAVVQEAAFSQDLRQAWGQGRYRFAYFNSVLAPQFAAIGKWLGRFPDQAMPAAAIEFGAPSGASSGGWFADFAEQYRAAARNFHSLDPDRLLLFTFDAAASAEYSRLMELPVRVLPAVHQAPCAVRPRERSPRGLTLGFLGQQRAEKGVNLLPDLIRSLLLSEPDLRFLIQDGDISDRPITRELARLAEQQPRVEFVHQSAGPALWRQMMERTDLMVLPYEIARYRASYSAVAVEAVGAGIPLVVPSGTSLESLAVEYQGAAASFALWDSESIAAAIRRAVRDFDRLASGALKGAQAWSRNNGSRAFVDQLLEFIKVTPGSVSRGVEESLPVSWFEKRTLDALLAIREVGKLAMHSVVGTERNAP